MGGVDFNEPRMRRVIEVLPTLAASPSDFTDSGLAAKIRSPSGSEGFLYGPRRAACGLKKLRAQKLVHKVKGTHGHEAVK